MTEFFSPEDFSDEPVFGELMVEDTHDAHNSPITISYRYVDLDATDYSFKQKFLPRDTYEYFNNMAYFSGRTIDQILNECDHDLHFHRTNCCGIIYKLLKKTWPDIDIDPSEAIIYHFSLYTDPCRASRQSGRRSPRVFFFLGNGGVIYPMFFDPFHEITPTDY